MCFTHGPNHLPKLGLNLELQLCWKLTVTTPTFQNKSIYRSPINRSLTSGEGDSSDPPADLRRVFFIPHVTVDTEPAAHSDQLNILITEGTKPKNLACCRTFSCVSCGSNVCRDTERRTCRAPGCRAAACEPPPLSWQRRCVQRPAAFSRDNLGGGVGLRYTQVWRTIRDTCENISSDT